MTNSMTKNFSPWLLILAGAALVFLPSIGFVFGYQYASIKFIDRLMVEVLPTPTSIALPSPEVLPTDTPVSATATATKTPKAVKKLFYALPSGWVAVANRDNTLEAGYNPGSMEPIMGTNAGDYEIVLTGKWFGDPPTGRGHSAMVGLVSYDGTARHQYLYKLLGITNPSSKEWKLDNFTEKEYSYNGWSCLVLNGIGISQYAPVWGICPVNSKTAVVFNHTGSFNEVERFISTIRLL